jgi:hypothetical protein
MAAKMNGGEAALPFEVVNRTASAHFTGGIPIGDSSDSGGNSGVSTVPITHNNAETQATGPKGAPSMHTS